MYEAREERRSGGGGFWRGVVLILVAAVVTAVVLVTRRLNAETLAFAGGILVAGIPLLALAVIGWSIAVRGMKSKPEAPQHQMMVPPMIIQMPQQQQQPQGWPANYGGNGGLDVYAGGKRDWAVIGDES